MKNAEKVIREALLGIAFIVASGGAVAASTADTSAASTNASNSANEGLEEIIVTATRREEPLQKVPISISAFSQVDLQERHITNIADLAAYTPGLQFALDNGYSSAFTTIAIRGLNTLAGASTVGVYLGDTVLTSRLSGYTNQGNIYPFAFDLNRIEVARGPQGTLFGGGAEAGTIRFIMNAPSTTEYTGDAKGELAETEGGALSYESGVAFGGPIVKDSIGFRVSAWDREDGGYTDHGNPFTGADERRMVNRVDKQAFNVAFVYAVNDDIRITPNVYYQQIHQNDAPRFYSIFSDQANSLFVNGIPAPEEWTDQWTLPSLKLEAHLPFADLTATGSYLYRHANESLDQSEFVCPFLAAGTCGNPLGNSYPVNSSQFSPAWTGLQMMATTGEVRLTSNHPDSRFTWVAGVFYDHRIQKDWQVSWSQAFFPPGTPLIPNSLYQENYERFTDDQIAAFANVDFRVTDKLTATVGERVAHLHTVVAEINPIATGGFPTYTLTSEKETPSLPRFGLSYQIDSNNLLYVSQSKGFRPGGASAQVNQSLCPGITIPTTYTSDTVQGWEAGAKDTVFGQRLQVNTSIYYYKWDNIQTFLGLPCPFNYTTNLGDAITKGFELSARGIVTDHLQMEIDISYVDAYYTTTTYNSYNQQIIAQTGDKIGAPPQVAPPWTVNTSANYDIPLGNDKVHLRAEFLYTARNPGPLISDLVGSPSYAPADVADPPTHVTNLRAGYKYSNGLDVTVFCNNVFNSLPWLGAWNNIPTSNLVSYTTLRPRTIGVSVNYPF